MKGEMSNQDGANVQKKSIGKGQTIVRSFGRDNSSASLGHTKDINMGGSTTNLAHSLSGTSANQRGK